MDKKKPRKRREVNYEYGDPRITVRAVFSYGHRKYEEYYIAKTGGIKAIKYDEFGAYTGTLPPEEVPVLGDFFQATAEPMKDQPPGTIKRLNEWMHEGMEPPQGPLSKKQRQEDHNGGLAVVDAVIPKGLFNVTPDYLYRLVSEGIPIGGKEGPYGKKKR